MNATQTLKGLLSGLWTRIVAQGGKLEQIKTDGTVVVLTGLWVEIGSQWVEVSCIELPDDPYDFGLLIEVCEITPIPEPSKFNRPPREEVKTFPENCRLDIHKEKGVTSVEAEDVVEHEGGLLCLSPIILKSSDGVAFKFAPSISPANVEIVALSSSQETL